MMRARDFAILFVCVVIAGVLLVVAGAQLDYINAQREQMNLTVNAPLENAPPALAFATVAMGAFRGLVVDILWMRADKLKEDGQFFDARQLAEWITTLQPRFASVWEFHAWNMAYNISVAIPATQPEQRWQWVKNGYELLRDKGIRWNPKSVRLYREMGRIFQHKMGGVSDDAHKYYKLRFAEMMTPLLSSEDNGLRPDDNEYFEALIQAPTEWSVVESDAQIAPFLQALRLADPAFADVDDKRFVQNYLSLRQNPQRFQQAAFEVIDSFRSSAALKRFDLFAKAYQLRREWKLDPAMMREINRKYGPIDFSDPNRHLPMDWRHPDCHAIYWAAKALQVAAENEGAEINMHETNTDRIVAHSLQNLFRYGKITILQGPAEVSEPDAGSESERLMRRDIFLGPDLKMFDSYNKAALAIIDKHAKAGASDEGPLESLRNGHRNMLKNAVMSFYQAGIRGYALRIYNELRKLYPIEDFNMPLDAYVRIRFREELDSIAIHDAVEMIVMTLTESYYLLAIGDDDTATVREQLAKDVYEHYLREYPDEKGRIDLPKMPVMRYVAIGQFLNNEMYPAYIRQGLLERIKVERPDVYKQLEQTEEQLKKEMEQQESLTK
jgi:hypothetical protein